MKDKVVAIQIGAPSFADEGVEACLDRLQALACVNTLFAVTYSYKDGLASRPWPPVDHGRQERGPQFHGGYYATLHPEYYRHTLFKANIDVVRAPDEGAFDLLGSLIPAARRRSLRTIAFLADQIHEGIAEFSEMAEWDLKGRALPRVCFNNPHFLAYLAAMVEDCVRSYDLDGLLWRSERWGSLSNALSLAQGRGPVRDAQTACFCPHCLREGEAQGINLDRVRTGYRLLEDFARSGRGDQRPTDGYYVSFWRLLLRFPEILTWDNFWFEGLKRVYSSIYAQVKGIKPHLSIGWALPATISFNPFYRAAISLRELARYSDFVKIIAYHTDGGPRCARYIDGMRGTWLGDLPSDQVLGFQYRMMGYLEGSYDEIRARGLSPEFVYRETRTWLDGVRGTGLQIWPGIDVDVSPGNTDSPRSREGVRDAVLSAFRAGAPGVVLSRMYSEMTLDHLAGAGDAVRAF